MKDSFLIRYKVLIICLWGIVFLLLTYLNPLGLTPVKILMYVLMMVYSTYLGVKQRTLDYFKRNIFYTMIGLLILAGAVYTYKFYQNKRIEEINKRIENKIIQREK